MEELEKDKEALSWLTRAWDDYAGNIPLLLPVLITQAALSAVSFYLIGRFHSLLAALPYRIAVEAADNESSFSYDPILQHTRFSSSRGGSSCALNGCA